MIKFKIILVIIFTFNYSFSNTGGELSYTMLANGKIMLTAKFYRDCRSIPTPSNLTTAGFIIGKNNSDSCGKKNLTFKRVLIQDISAKCSTQGKPCNPNNTTTGNYGTEMHVYTSEIDLTDSTIKKMIAGKNCNELLIWFTYDYSHGSSNCPIYFPYYYLVINLNNLSKCNVTLNNSVSFLNTPVFNTPTDINFIYNFGANDTTDHDSISYQMQPLLYDFPNYYMNFYSGYNYDFPFTAYCKNNIPCKSNPNYDPPIGFYLDSSNGDIIFRPTLNESGIICLRVSEWRKDTFGVYRNIGYSIKYMVFLISSNAEYNNQPKISAQTYHEVKGGNKICFSIVGTDKTFPNKQTIPDTVLLSWDKGIKKASFTIKNPKKREKEAEFCWQTDTTDISEIAYNFTVTANDQHCDLPLQSVKSFKIKVLKTPIFTYKTKKLPCNKLEINCTVLAGKMDCTRYFFSLLDSNKKIVFTSNNSQIDTLQYYFSGKHYLKIRIANGYNCYSEILDSFVFLNAKEIKIQNPGFACSSGKIWIAANIKNLEKPFSYWWKCNDKKIGADTTTGIFFNQFYTDTFISLKIIDNANCAFNDSIKIKSIPNPKVNLGRDLRICPGETVKIETTNDSTCKFLWNTGDTLIFIRASSPKKYIVNKINKQFGCIGTDTLQLFVNNIIEKADNPNRRVCTGDSITLKCNLKYTNDTNASFKWSKLNGGNFLSSNPEYKILGKLNNIDNNPETLYYFLKTVVKQDTLFCSQNDTFTILITPKPTIKWKSIPLIETCYNTNNYNLIGAANNLLLEPNFSMISPNNLQIILDSNNLYDSIAYNLRNINFAMAHNINFESNISAKYTDSNGCMVKSLNNILVKQKPEGIITTNPIAENKIRITSINKNAHSFFWDFGNGNQSTDSINIVTYLNAAKYVVTLKLKNNNGCTTELRDSLSIYLHSKKPSIYSLVIYPNPNNGDFLILANANKIQRISITNQLGVNIPFITENRLNETRVRILNVPNGLYLLQIDGVITKLFIWK